MFWNKYPYTNFHELNLDCILQQMQTLNNEWDEFTALNKITNAGSWDIAEPYAAWSIVTYNNIGYISLVPVPAGILITNTEYWEQIADYTFVITDLTNRIEALETAQGNISDLNTSQKDNLVNAINETYQIATASNNRKVVFIADSYATFYRSLDSKNYIELGAEYAGITDYYDFHLSGAGFCRPGNQAFLQVLQNNESVITNKGEVTDIVVCGSANDQTGTYTDVVNEIRYFTTYCRTNYPNAKIHIGSFSKSIEHDYVSVVPDTLRAYIDGAALNGLHYIDHSECIMAHYQLYRADHLHPTETGIGELGKYLGLYLSSGSIEVVRELNYNNHNWPVFDSGGDFEEDTDRTTTVLMSQRNNAIKLSGSSRGILMYFKTRNSLSVGTSGLIKNAVAHVTDNLFYATDDTSFVINGLFGWYTGGRDYILPGSITFTRDLTSDGIQIDFALQNYTGEAVSIASGQKMSFFGMGSNTFVQ